MSTGTRPKGVTHGTWNKNPGNIKGYRPDGKPTDFTKWLDKEGIPYTKGTKASDGGWFIKFENDSDGLKAADNFWGVVKTWAPYKNKTVEEALGVYAADGYDQNFLDNLSKKGIDLNARLDSLASDSLAVISHHQMQTEDPNQYKNLQSSGLISKDGVSQYYKGATAPTEEQAKDNLSPKEKREIERITKMDKTVALHREQSSAFASLEDNNKFEIKTKLENILKDIHADMKSGKFDKDMKAQYEKDGKTLPLLKDASRGKIVSGIIAERMGWNDLDLNNPEILGIARAQSAYVFELTQDKEFQESIGGTQKIDSLLEDVLEDNSNTSGRFAEFTGIPELGYALPEVEKEVRTPTGKGGILGGEEGDVEFWDEPGKKGKINLDGYEEWRDQHARQFAPSLFFDQSADQSTASIISDAQEVIEQEKEVEIAVDEDADVEDDFEIEEIDLSLAPELDLSFEDWKIKNPNGTREEYDNRGATSEVSEGDSGYQNWLKDNPGGTREEYQKYFDLRGDTSGLGKESFLDKIGGLSSLIGLATGAMGLGQALKDVDIPKDPKLGPAFQQRLEESKRLAQQGLTPSELAKAHNDLDSSYATGIENIVRGSAGNRAQFLAGLGGLDVARQSALMDIAVADASMQRQNQEKYDKMMMVNEQYEAARTSKYDQAKFEQDMATKSAGAALAGSALSMVNENIGNRQLNRYNKLKTEKLMRDMGYKNDSNGRSTEQQMGVDPETGEKVQTSFTLPGDDSYVAPNLLNADEQVINTKVENSANSNDWITQNQGLLGALGGNYSGLIGAVDPSEKARLAKEKKDNEIKNNAIANFNSALNF